MPHLARFRDSIDQGVAGWHARRVDIKQFRNVLYSRNVFTKYLTAKLERSTSWKHRICRVLSFIGLYNLVILLGYCEEFSVAAAPTALSRSLT